jgi:hypothetical protein
MDNKKGLFRFLCIICIFGVSCMYSCTNDNTTPIALKGDGISLNFDSSLKNQELTIKRAKGKFGNYQVVGTTKNASYVDKNVEGSPYDYYYQVVNSAGSVVSSLSLEQELFGPNLYVYHPEDDMDAISKEVNGIQAEMQRGEFSKNRYAFFFLPGDYTKAGVMNIPYYVHIGGLGKTPYDVKLSNVHTPPSSWPRGTGALSSFWRSAENFSVIGPQSDELMETFMWGVSQAAPIRRIYSQRNTFYSWMNGSCSGGFTADCYFEGYMGANSQQQWYTRNSHIENGRGLFGVGGWNNTYQGVEFGPGVDLADHSDNWGRDNVASWGNVSRVETTPLIREKPFLFYDNGSYKVFKPALREPDSKGVSYTRDNMGEGTVYDLLKDFYVVKPGESASVMNKQLAAGKHLFITPGMYELSEPLRVTKPNTIILGTGLATLIPGPQNPDAAIIVDDVEGVTIASLLFDAHYNSKTLLRVGPDDSNKNHSKNPSLCADLFFRVGGFRSENVNVDVAFEVNSDDVIGDHFWIWRADHGDGVGWFKNTSKNGLVVNGDCVTIYGLFNEHFQEYQTLWNGEKGRMYFYQCETPYDATDQSHYMSHNGTVKGYSAYKVADHVKYHNAYMMGIYDVFTKTQGSEIVIENSMEVPNSAGVKIHNACNVCISPLGGFNFVINGTIQSTCNTRIGNRYFVIDYTGDNTPEPWTRKN